MWVSEEALKEWTKPEPSEKRGHPETYSDVAIECMAMLQAVYRLALRQTHGLVQSVFEMMRIVLRVPHYGTLSRRKQTLDVQLPKQKPKPGEAEAGRRGAGGD